MILVHVSATGLPSEGASVGRYVRAAVRAIEASGLRNEVHAMGTEIECPDLEAAWRVLSRVHEAVRGAGAQRITMHVKLEERLDRVQSLSDKVRSAQTGRAAPTR